MKSLVSGPKRGKRQGLPVLEQIRTILLDNVLLQFIGVLVGKYQKGKHE